MGLVMQPKLRSWKACEFEYNTFPSSIYERQGFGYIYNKTHNLYLRSDGEVSVCIRGEEDWVTPRQADELLYTLRADYSDVEPTLQQQLDNIVDRLIRIEKVLAL